MADLAPSGTLLRPSDLYALRVVSWCSLNPSRTAVAYAVTRMSEETNTYRGSIRIVSFDASSAGQAQAGASRTLTDGSARDQAPQWSADGSSIFFLSDRASGMQLWEVSANGGGPKPLPLLPGNVSEFAVAPRGRRIAAIAVPTAKREQINSQSWRRITRIRYRSDGAGYLDDLPEIWLIDLATSAVKKITDGSGFVAGLAWDPAGEQLAFAGDHRADADSLWRRELWTAASPEDWSPHQILAMGTAAEAPAWSPDSSRIAFCGIAEPLGGVGGKNMRLYAVDANGQHLECLTQNEEWTCGNFVLTDVGAAGSVAAPIWTTSQELAVLGSSRGAARVMRVRPGTKAKPLTPPDMSVTQFQMIDAETVVACASTLLAPPELCVRHGDRTAALTSETQEWSSGQACAPTSFTVRLADREIDAWHYAGTGPQPRPCILYIHGGPHFAYGHAFVFHFLMLAAAGYDVVVCNPRGSQSYGEAFAFEIARNWAQPAFDDCMAVLDAALGRFSIDATRLGVAGGSYGGYLTVWTVAHSSRFRAAVALRPAVNLVSLWGTSEVGRMLAEDFGGSPFDEPRIYKEDSPLWQADAIETPLLLIFGDQDYRTPAEQSEQLLTALLHRGGTAEGLQLLGADHNISRGGPPRLRVAHETAILEWFDRFLR